MARIRSTHPTQWTDEAFVTCSMAARLLAIAIRNDADDNGIFEWKPLQIKMRLFPADNVDIEELLKELVDTNQVMSSELNGRKYGAIRNFTRFQRPKKPNTVHPINDEFRTYVGLTSSSSPPVTHQLPTSGEKSPQMEDVGGKRKEVISKSAAEKSASPKKRGSRLPDDWIPDQGDRSLRELVDRLKLTPEHLQNQFDSFRDYWSSKPGKDGVKLDWQATWRNWLRNSRQTHSKPNGKSTRSEIDRALFEAAAGKDANNGKQPERAIRPGLEILPAAK